MTVKEFIEKISEGIQHKDISVWKLGKYGWEQTLYSDIQKVENEKIQNISFSVNGWRDIECDIFI